jgi:hypothetical protein
MMVLTNRADQAGTVMAGRRRNVRRRDPPYLVAGEQLRHQQRSRGEHLFRNVPTFGRLRVFARGFCRVLWRVAVTPDGPSYRMTIRRRSALVLH